MILNPRIETGSNCTFPLTSGRDGEPALSPDECTRTYAAGYGAKLIAPCAVSAFIALATSLLALRRVHAFARLGAAQRKGRGWGQGGGGGTLGLCSASNPASAPLQYQVVAAVLGLALLVSDIDRFAFAGILPFEAYFALQGVFYAAALTLAIVFIDFVVRLADVSRARSFAERHRKTIFLLVTWAVHVVFITACLVRLDYFYIIVGVWNVLDAGLCVAAILAARSQIRRMLGILGRGLAAQQTSESAANIKRSVLRSFAYFIVALGVGAVFFFVSGVTNFVKGSPAYRQRYEDGLSAVTMLVMAVETLVVVLISLVFSTPGSRTGDEAPLAPGRGANVAAGPGGGPSGPAAGGGGAPLARTAASPAAAGGAAPAFSSKSKSGGGSSKDNAKTPTTTVVSNVQAFGVMVAHAGGEPGA